MEFADGRSAFFRAIEIRLMFMFVLCAHKFRSNVWAGRKIFGISIDFTLWTPSDHDADISGISVTKLSICRAYNGYAFTHQTQGCGLATDGQNNRGGAAKDRQTEQPDGLEKEV